MPTLVDLTTRSGIEEKERKLLADLARHGPRDRGLLRRHRLRLSGVGGEPRAGRQRRGHHGGLRLAARIAQARCRGVRANASASSTSTSRRSEFDNPDYVANDPDRCFHCKDELFTRLEEVGRERGYQHIIYGVNVDDLGDYRPGQNAAKQHQVAAPLADAGLTKAEIRELSRLADLPTWDRPASACLSSRIPYGTPVTIQNVKTVETGEEEIKALGFRQFRVRFHGEVVRIEIAREEMERALTMEMAQRFTAIFKALGFKYVTLDLEGYRQGSLNEVLNLKK